MDLKFICLDNIDYENDNVIRKEINLNDAQEYINSLVYKILNTNTKREYESKEVSFVMDKIREIIQGYLPINEAAITTLSEDINDETNINFQDLTCNISKKLCQEQAKARDKYRQLTTIQRGSLVQALVNDENKLIYLMCLVEHAKFIDEDDLKYKIGLPSSEKATLKSCIISCDSDGNFEKIFVTDTKNKFTEYWYDGFLELSEKRSDRTNTKEAFKTIKRVIDDSLSLSHKADCNILNNSLKVIFTQGGNFTFDECLYFLFDNYIPESSELNITDLRRKIEDRANICNKFDKVFTIDNTDIKSSLTNIKYSVTDNIEVKLKTPKKDLQDYIYSSKIEGEEQVLIIRNINDDTYKKFLKDNNRE